eukprot:5344509-Alexandrium_andersonii.AAC.1
MATMHDWPCVREDNMKHDADGANGVENNAETHNSWPTPHRLAYRSLGQASLTTHNDSNTLTRRAEERAHFFQKHGG